MATQFNEGKYPRSKYSGSLSEGAPEEHPSQDRTGRCSQDAHLRANGYEIHSRPKQGPVLWRRKSDGVILEESLILSILQRNPKK